MPLLKIFRYYLEYFIFIFTAPAEEKDLLHFINDARRNPGKYPPRGNAAGAAMTACPVGFKFSRSLWGIARDHSQYLATQPKAWVTSGDNMHRGPKGELPKGKLVWEAGEPMERAGYRTWKAENVAVGFSSAEAAVRFWMQDDAEHNWGHRNAILRCATREAGVGHHAGGPWGHYWTLDMGTI